MRHKTIVRGIEALVIALVLVIGLAGAAYAQDVDVIEEPGVLITGVVADSPAATAGLARGDVILAVNDVIVNNAEDLADAVQSVDPGAIITLTVLHGDEQSVIPVIVAERGGGSFLGVRPYTEDVSMPAMPMEIMPIEPITGTEVVTESEQVTGGEPVTLTLEEREVTSPTGAVVAAVLPGSPAEAADIQAGDVIAAVDGASITDAADLVAAIAGYTPGAQVMLDVRHAGELDTQPVAVTLAGRPDDNEQAYLGVSVGPASSEEEDVWDDQGDQDDQDDQDGWDDSDEWNEPHDGWECPQRHGDGYPHYGHGGWRGPMMPHHGDHPHGHMGWGNPRMMPYGNMHGHMGWRGPAMMPYGGGPRMSMRIPYHGQGYGWHR